MKFCLMILASLILIGCSTKSPTDTEDRGSTHTVDPSTLAGTSWKLVGVERQREDEVLAVETPDSVLYTLRFGSDGHAGGWAGCREYLFDYSLATEGSKIGMEVDNLEELASPTCNDNQVDVDFFRIVGEASSLSFGTTPSWLVVYGDLDAEGWREALHFYPL